MENTKTILLSYVSYPVTTAVYYERALRKICNVLTIGPKLPSVMIERWQLQNMKLPNNDHDIPTSFTPDMAELYPAISRKVQPDLYLWIESVGGHYPENLDAISCPKACYLIDSHLNLAMHLEWAKQFDRVFIAQ